MLSAMQYLGADGCDIVTVGSAVVGHLHSWHTPEEVGERQPLTHSEASLTLALDGRLDNREELYARLRGRLPRLEELSDASLVLHAYRKHGIDCVPWLMGAFTFAVYDATRREVVLTCDPMGSRSIFYWLSDRLFLVASEPGGVLAHPDIGVELDHGPLVRYFAYSEQADAKTCFRGVKALLPAHVMRVGPDYIDIKSVWPFEPKARLHYRRDEEYAEHFLEVFTKSVVCRLRSVEKPAVALSGGLDSAPIAAVAARHLSTHGRRLTAASWVFDRFDACDEREYLEQLYRSHPLEPLQVNCDSAWPLSEFHSWPIHPCTPFQNPYRRFHENLYNALERSGVRVLLSGLMGDHLYTGTERWLHDLIAERRLGNAIGESMWYVNRNGWLAFLRQGILRGLLPHGVYRALRPRPTPEWLTPFARSHLDDSDPWPRESKQARRPNQYFRALELVNGLGYIERYFAGRYRIELRYPFRDRRLVEFMLRLPTHQLHARGVARPIVRRALRGKVPGKILARPGKASFQPLYTLGLCQKERRRVDAWLEAGDSLWTRYVDRDWLLSKRECEGMRGYVYWLCISLEMWSRYTPAGHRIREAQTR